MNAVPKKNLKHMEEGVQRAGNAKVEQVPAQQIGVSVLAVFMGVTV